MNTLYLHVNAVQSHHVKLEENKMFASNLAQIQKTEVLFRSKVFQIEIGVIWQGNKSVFNNELKHFPSMMLAKIPTLTMYLYVGLITVST